MHHNSITVPPFAEPELERIREEIARLENRVAELKSAIPLNRVKTRSDVPVHISEGMVRQLLKARRLRETLLGVDLFADPAWDILLEAFACQLGQKRTSVSGLQEASGVPPTTALRWIKKLEQSGWLKREADWSDARRQWIELTCEGSVKIRSFLETAWHTLLPITADS